MDKLPEHSGTFIIDRCIDTSVPEVKLHLQGHPDMCEHVKDEDQILRTFWIT